MNHSWKWAGIVIFYIVICFFSLITLNTRTDEIQSHLPNLEGVYNNGINHVFSENYAAANTPLPYILIAYVCKITGFNISLSLARTAGMITGIVFLIILANILQGYKTDLYLTLVSILLYPYFIKTTFSFHPSIYGLLFCLLSLFFLKSDKIHYLLLAGFFAALAVLSQQIYLFLPLWFAITTFIRYYKNDFNFSCFFKKNLIFNLFMVLPFYFLVSWNGITAEQFRHHSISFGANSLCNLTGIIIVFGGIFFPFVFEKFKTFKLESVLIIAAISVLMCLFFSPKWNAFGGSGEISGYTFKVLNRLSEYSYLIYFLVEVVLTFLGLLLLYYIIFSTSINIEYKLLVITAGLGLLLLDIFSERYLVHLVILIIVLVYRTLKRRITKYVLASWISIQGLVFYWYWILR